MLFMSVWFVAREKNRVTNQRKLVRLLKFTQVRMSARTQVCLFESDNGCQTWTATEAGAATGVDLWHAAGNRGAGLWTRLWRTGPAADWPIGPDLVNMRSWMQPDAGKQADEGGTQEGIKSEPGAEPVTTSPSITFGLSSRSKKLNQKGQKLRWIIVWLHLRVVQSSVTEAV